jgi:hypothetical protein
VQLGQPVGDAPGLAQEAIDGTSGARQPLALQALIAGQVVQQCFGTWRPPQAFWRLIAHLDDAVDHHLADALGRVLACTRLAVQDGFILRWRLLQTLDPFLNPAHRHTHRLGIVLARPGGLIFEQPP